MTSLNLPIGWLLFSHSVMSDPTDCSTPGFPVHHQLPEFAQTQVHWVDDAIQPSHLLSSLLLLPSIFPSIRVFSSELAFHIRWPKYWSFSFSMSPSNEYPGLISFKTDWFDLLAVWGTLESQAIRHARLVPLSVRLFSSALKIVSRHLTCQPGRRPMLRERVGGHDLLIPSRVWGLSTVAEEHILKKEPKDGQLRRKVCLFQTSLR